MVDEDKERSTRLELARDTAAQLLEELETGSVPVAQSLMRAKRLARLLRDEEAQRWLDYELKGYPNAFDFSLLGSCQRYAVEGGRLTAEGKYWPQSLPKIEAEFKAAEATLNLLRMPAIDKPVQNYLEAGATMQLIQSAQQHLAAS
ncbi:MAG: hypothetical protein V1861_05675, partial [Candidatus Micrarchaeota archaeon]